MHPAVHSVQGSLVKLYDRRSLDQVLSDVDVAIERTRARNRELELIEKLTRERAREREPATTRDNLLDWLAAVIFVGVGCGVVAAASVWTGAMP